MLEVRSRECGSFVAASIDLARATAKSSPANRLVLDRSNGTANLDAGSPVADSGSSSPQTPTVDVARWRSRSNRGRGQSRWSSNGLRIPDGAWDFLASSDPMRLLRGEFGAVNPWVVPRAAAQDRCQAWLSTAPDRSLDVPGGVFRKVFPGPEPPSDPLSRARERRFRRHGVGFHDTTRARGSGGRPAGSGPCRVPRRCTPDPALAGPPAGGHFFSAGSSDPGRGSARPGHRGAQGGPEGGSPEPRSALGTGHSDGPRDTRARCGLALRSSGSMAQRGPVAQVGPSLRWALRSGRRCHAARRVPRCAPARGPQRARARGRGPSPTPPARSDALRPRCRRPRASCRGWTGGCPGRGPPGLCSRS